MRRILILKYFAVHGGFDIDEDEDGELLDELLLKSDDEEEEINGQDPYEKVK